VSWEELVVLSREEDRIREEWVEREREGEEGVREGGKMEEEEEDEEGVEFVIREDYWG
jgi:hypothetical protein